MSSSKHEHGQRPVVCCSCRQFYGSPQTRDMCSRCFGQSSPSAPTPTPLPADDPTPASASPSYEHCAALEEAKDKIDVSNLTVQIPESASSSGRPHKVKKRTRCFFDSCRRKVTAFSGFECACSGTYRFCPEHRLPMSHFCSVDRKQQNARKISRANPKLQAPKLQKI
mmetsp:Transcript_3136/g.6551  ORF Transcript_3136/g.6551 Transcript_3136/m.6551 type:complete len:168 (+) Transcript_3136:50-553(+)